MSCFFFIMTQPTGVLLLAARCLMIHTINIETVKFSLNLKMKITRIISNLKLKVKGLIVILTIIQMDTGGPSYTSTHTKLQYNCITFPSGVFSLPGYPTYLRQAVVMAHALAGYRHTRMRFTVQYSCGLTCLMPSRLQGGTGTNQNARRLGMQRGVFP